MCHILIYGVKSNNLFFQTDQFQFYLSNVKFRYFLIRYLIIGVKTKFL